MYRKIGLALSLVVMVGSCKTGGPVVESQALDAGDDRPSIAEPISGQCNTTAQAMKNAIIHDFVHDGVQMFGCAEAFPQNPSTCMSNFPEMNQWKERQQLGNYQIRELISDVGDTAYWFRTSADGRFVATGNGLIFDLKNADRKIDVAGASIDPAFSPDNKWYAWIGMICKQAPLYDESIDRVGEGVANAECVSNSFNDYASIGYDARGGFLSFTNYSSTNYGSASGQDGSVGDFFTQNPLTMRRIDNYDLTGESIRFQFTGEEDYLLSPSGQLMVGRLVDEEMEEGVQRAYRIRMLYPDGNTLDPTNNETISTACLRGEKPNISYDNRFVTFHHYTERGGPQGGGADEQLRYQIQEEGANPGSGNIFVYDLHTDKGYRVTNMPSGSSALFPHFRADGWLLFQVKNQNGSEQIAATDAAIVLKGGGGTTSARSEGDTCGENPQRTPGGYCYADRDGRRVRVAGSCCE